LRDAVAEVSTAAVALSNAVEEISNKLKAVERSVGVKGDGKGGKLIRF